MVISTKKALPTLVIIITIISVNPWSKYPLGNTFIDWGIILLTILAVFWYKKLYFSPPNKTDYTIITIFLLWMMVGSFRGILVAENYWEWKQLIAGSFSLSLPLLVYVFSIPNILQRVLHYWIKIALPLFFFIIVWLINSDVWHFYLAPVFLFAIFIPVLPKKWGFIILGLTLAMLIINLGARSQVIKSSIALLIVSLYFFPKALSIKLIKIGHWIFYLLPALLLYLSISGTFNPFEFLASNTGKYSSTKEVNGEIETQDLAADTRTFIYYEVITSAINNNYVLFGRTPARGNDSAAFGKKIEQELNTGKYERHRNEVCFPNVFTWLGLIGMILYCLIYFKSSYLAVFKSNNYYIKLIGLFIAFRFLYGWIEDVNSFDINSISIWMMIAMGFSQEFRNMTDHEFTCWLKNIFKKRKNESSMALQH